jgi:hypothetical protein
MTSGPDPPRVSYGDPFTPWLCQARRTVARVTCRCQPAAPQVAQKSPLVERSLCSIPWQGDFPRGNVPTVKDALRSIHWKLDDRPISMKLYEFAATDGPEETSATEMHQRIIAMATEQPSENSRHLTDFQGTLEPARDFGLERRGIAAVYAGELTIEEAR